MEEVLAKCDREGSEAWETARLGSILRRPLVGDRRAAWQKLAESPNVRVREEAIQAIKQHPEVGESARAVLTAALSSGAPGLVATAADVLTAHPDRALAGTEIDARLTAALGAAVGHAWSEDLVETRANLLDAAVSVRLPIARDTATAMCKDANATVRDRAAKALRALGDANAVCALDPALPPTANDALDPVLPRATRVVFDFDAAVGSPLAIRFEPDLAPVTAARFVELARAGFFTGIVVHRVVPGFVVQFGDPGGDGFGGSGRLLRCETSPVPFDALDVGVALAGRDTGSSQLFVTLARYPHLDGEYARVGRAEGDWAKVAVGDVIKGAHIVE
jgi:cyclophilin family peptidyl-prolyl cis-trans isomerase